MMSHGTVAEAIVAFVSWLLMIELFNKNNLSLALTYSIKSSSVFGKAEALNLLAVKL